MNENPTSSSRELWVGLVEVHAAAGSAPALLDRNDAYTNVLAWCTSEIEFRRCAELAASDIGMRVVDIEDVERVDDRGGVEALDAGMFAIAMKVMKDGHPRVCTLHTWTSPD